MLNIKYNILPVMHNFIIKFLFKKTRGPYPPTRTAHQPLIAGAEPLATHARQVPFVPCEY